MTFKIDHPDFLKDPLTVLPAGWLSGAKLMHRGALVQGKRSKYAVIDDAGNRREVQIKSAVVDPVPILLVDGNAVRLARPLTWYEYGWMALPILMVFAGGALGALLGLGAAYSSARIFRSGRGTVMKYLLSGVISAGAVVAFLVVGVIIQVLLA